MMLFLLLEAACKLSNFYNKHSVDFYLSFHEGFKRLLVKTTLIY